MVKKVLRVSVMSCRYENCRETLLTTFIYGCKFINKKLASIFEIGKFNQENSKLKNFKL